MKPKIAKATHRMFIRKLIDQGTDSRGARWVKTAWEEVPEINLGSIKAPNKEIREIAMIPINEEEDDDRPSLNDLFRRFLK